jgi:hypothetical protein
VYKHAHLKKKKIRGRMEDRKKMEGGKKKWNDAP